MTDLWTDPSSLGDPAGMRSTAQSLRAIAEEISARMEDLARRSGGTTFEGPAAARLAHRMESHRKRVNREAQRLMDASATLLRSAAQVEEEIAILKRRQQEAREAEAREAEAREAEAREMWT